MILWLLIIVDNYYCEIIIYVNNYLWLLVIIRDYFMIIDNDWWLFYDYFMIDDN